MKSLTPILACGSMDLGPGFTVMLLSCAAIWLAGIVLGFINLFLIGSLKGSVQFTIINIGIFFIYAASAIALFAGMFDETSLIVAPIFGVPIVSISHFVYLLCVRRRLGKQKTVENRGETGRAEIRG
jgi:hypothetical protein